jgi:hypothetical protein
MAGESFYTRSPRGTLGFCKLSQTLCRICAVNPVRRSGRVVPATRSPLPHGMKFKRHDWPSFKKYQVKQMSRLKWTRTSLSSEILHVRGARIAHYGNTAYQNSFCEEGLIMARCEVCGNEYDKAMKIILEGQIHVFDSFECAVHALAPTCGHCGCRVIGHGIEADDAIYCCAHCAEKSGVTSARDHV